MRYICNRSSLKVKARGDSLSEQLRTEKSIEDDEQTKIGAYKDIGASNHSNSIDTKS